MDSYQITNQDHRVTFHHRMATTSMMAGVATVLLIIVLQLLLGLVGITSGYYVFAYAATILFFSVVLLGILTLVTGFIGIHSEHRKTRAIVGLILGMIFVFVMGWMVADLRVFGAGWMLI